MNLRVRVYVHFNFLVLISYFVTNSHKLSQRKKKCKGINESIHGFF